MALADRSHYCLAVPWPGANLGEALHQAGDVAGATALFAEAEAFLRFYRPKYRLLHSLAGYQYHDFLLEQGQADKVLRRAKHTLEISNGTTFVAHRP